MRKNVTYAEITCDVCGKKEYIPQTLILPDGWNRIKVGYEEWDACPECVTMITNHIKRLQEKYYEQDE